MIYYINNETKEHRKAPAGVSSPGNTWSVALADPGGWIEWHEEDGNPLPDHHPCDVMLFRKRVVKNVFAYDNPAWEGVTHYRPILDADTKPEPPARDGEGKPPVGSRWLDGDGDTVEIIAHHAGHAVCYMVDYSGYQYVETPYEELRPIRSEEDRAVTRIQSESQAEIGGPISTSQALRIYHAIRDGKIPGLTITGGEG